MSKSEISDRHLFEIIITTKKLNTMNEFMFIIRGGSDEMPDQSPEAMQKTHARLECMDGSFSRKGITGWRSTTRKPW